MKGRILSLLLLTLSIAAQAQLDSLQQKIGSALDKINGDSIGDNLVQLPDSLLPAYNKIDSVRIAFNDEADSIRTEYQRAISKIDAGTTRINNRIDSLSHLNLPTTKYTQSLDSLQQLRQKAETKFSSKLNDLKARTTGKLNALDLPPEYKEPIQKLTGKIDALSLDLPDIKIPALDNPGFSIPKSEGIAVLASKAGEIENIDRLADLSDIKSPVGDLGGSTGSPTGIDNLSETIESQASRIDGMDELQKQSGIIDANKAKLDGLNDPARAKEKAVELAKKAAVDHFAGKQEQLKAAMEKISKYKQKYSSVSSIKDLPKRPPNPMKGKPFVTRLVPGLYLQYQRKDLYLADINPYLGYKLSGRFISGLGWNRRYAYDGKNKAFSSRSVIFGPRAYVDFKLGKGFIAHLEGEYMNSFVPSTLLGNPDTGQREWVASFMTGIKKEYRIYKNLKGTALIQYNLFNRYYKAPYVDRLNSRIGFEYLLKVNKKKPASPKATRSGNK